MDDKITLVNCPACRGLLTSSRKDPATGWKLKCDRCDGSGLVKVPVAQEQ
jgi:hypothetical protein